MGTTQWRVRNYEENKEITYWIAGENFNFYAPMAGLALTLEEQYLFYKSIPENNIQGVMPLRIEERTLLRIPKSTTQITKVKEKHIDKMVFDVSSYTKFNTLH